MSSPLETDGSMLTELVHLRRQVLELQQALADTKPGRSHIQATSLRTVHMGTWEWDGRTNQIIWSSGTEQIFGLPPHAFDDTYEGFFALVHPDDRHRFSTTVAKAFEDRSPYRSEHRIITPSGAVRWVACQGRALFNENESVSGMIGTVEDITSRKELELDQQNRRETLETLVQERTARLELAIRELKDEVERRKEAEFALRWSEQRYQSLYEQNPFMYFTLSPDGAVLSVNHVGADQLGYQKVELIGCSILKLFDSKDQRIVLEQLTACSASPYTLFQWEAQKVRKDGTRLWVKERARAIHDHTGQLLILVACEDITERKRTEKQLCETSRLLQTLVEESALPLVSLDRDARVISWNQAATRLFGWSKEEVIGRELPYIHPEEEGTAEALWQAGTRGELTGPIELTRRRKDGKMLNLLLWPVFVYDELDQVSLAVGLYVDQSDLKRAEEATIRGEARLRSFLDALDDLAFEFDQDGRYLNVWTHSNDKLLLPKQELIGKCITDLFGYEAGSRYVGTIRHVLTTGKAATINYAVRLNHEVRYFSGVLTLIPGNETCHATVGCIVRDVTDSRLVDAKVRESEARWRAIYEHAGVGIAELGLDGQFLRVNPHLCELLGYSPESMAQMKFHELTHPEDLTSNLADLDELLTEGRPSFSMEKRYRRSNNTYVWVHLTVSRVRDTSGSQNYLIAVIQNIDSRKRAEDQLKENEWAIRSLHEATSDPVLTLDQRIQTVLELGCRRFGTSIGFVTQLAGTRLILTHSWNTDSSRPLEPNLHLWEADCRSILERDTSLTVDYGGDWERNRSPEYVGSANHRYIGTQLTTEGRAHGTLCFTGTISDFHTLSRADNDFLLLTARWISGELIRKNSERALEEQEALLRSVIETATDAIFMKDVDGRYRFINSAGAGTMGRAPEEIVGKTDVELLPPSSATQCMNSDRDVFSGAAQRRFEEIVPVNGESRAFHLIKTPHRDQNGRVIGLVGVARDMTDIRRTEQALRLTQIAVDRSADLVFWIDTSARFLYVNDAACQRLGYTREELLRMTVADIDLECQSDRWPEHWEELRRVGRLRFESRHRTQSGSTYPVEIVANFVAVEGREYNVVFARDVSDRKRSYSLLQAVINSVAEGLLVIDRLGKITSFNQRFLHLWNIPQPLADSKDDEALLSFVVDQLQAPEAFLRKVRQLYAHPDQESVDVLEFKDGRVFERYGRPQILDGEIVGRVWSFRDITEQRRAEQALRESELRLQRFVAEAPVGLCILDENWRTISANRAFCELTGYETHEIIGSTYALYTHPEDLSANILLTEEFYRGVRSGYTFEKRYIRKSGEIVWVLVKATRIELSGHQSPLLLAAVQDITERKLAVEEREQLSRDLHDNLLQALYAVGMQLEAGKLAMGQSQRRSKAHMSQAINQLNNLIIDVRRFIATLTERTPAELDFGQALRQLAASVAGTEHTAPELDIKNPVLSFITPQIGEQLLNITREALSNSLRHARASRRWIELSVVDNSICLLIGDNGVGFSPQRRRRRGRGLANMAARSQRILATLTLDSAPGCGTTIRVDVPLRKGMVYE